MSKNVKFCLLQDGSYYFEKYALSSFMLYYALKNVLLMSQGIMSLLDLENTLGQGSFDNIAAVNMYYAITRCGILFLFNTFNGILLLLSKRPQQAPTGWRDIWIPALSSYSMLAYNWTEHLPQWMATNATPENFTFPFLLISCVLSLSGQILSLVAVLYLRRSFALFIQLRDVVMNGPYKYVRHPMYTGYVLVVFGILLSNLSFAYMLISALYLGLLAYRARLEETMLSANNSAYKINMNTTGLLFPKLSTILAAVRITPVA